MPRMLILLCFSLFVSFQGYSAKSYTFDDLNEAKLLVTINPDQGIKLAEACLQYAIENKDTTLALESYLNCGRFCFAQMRFNKAIDYSNAALLMAEKYNNIYLLAQSYRLMGNIYHNLSQVDDGKRYLKSALQLYHQSTQKGVVDKGILIPMYFDLVLLHRKNEEYDQALTYLDTCYSLSTETNQVPVGRAYLYSEEGNLLLLKGQFKSSRKQLFKALKTFEAIEHTPEKPSTDKSYIILIYNNLAKNYYQSGNQVKAEEFYLKTLDAVDQYKRYNGVKGEILEEYSKLQYQQGRHQEAYENLELSKKINDEYFSSRSFKNRDFLKIRNYYKDELNNKDRVIAESKLEIAEKRESILIFRIVLLLIIIVIILAIFIVRTRIKQADFKRQKEENEKQKQEQNTLIEIKNKELTTYTLKLIEKNEFIDNLVKDIGEDHSNIRSKTLLKNAHKNSENLWEDFNSRFIAVNESFYKRILELYPTISQTELKHLALIKLNFSSKEMARLLNISPNSVHMSRHRIRKKMNLGRDDSLEKVLSSI